MSRPITFKVAHGASLTLDAKETASFATTKTEQVAVLTDLIADAAMGCEIKITEQSLSILAALAGELSFAAKNAVFALVEAGEAHSAKGGA
jgi:hypothetical protein